MLEALLLIVATLAADRMINVPRDVRRNDEMLRNRSEDLSTWIEDEDRWLKNEFIEVRRAAAFESVREQIGRRNAWVIPYRHEQLKDGLRHRYRDQLRDAERVFRSVALTEETGHHIYRRVRGRPVPALDAPTRQTKILEDWNERAESQEQVQERIAAEFGDLARIRDEKARQSTGIG